MSSSHALPSWWRRLRSHRVEVVEASMQPALLPGDRLLVDGAAYRDRSPRVGEIVLLEDPERPGRVLLKRVAAPPDAPPAEGVWVLGDNAPLSRDSRHFGLVPVDRLRGRAYFRYAPRERRGFLGEGSRSPDAASPG